MFSTSQVKSELNYLFEMRRKQKKREKRRLSYQSDKETLDVYLEVAAAFSSPVKKIPWNLIKVCCVKLAEIETYVECIREEAGTTTRKTAEHKIHIAY